MKWIGQHIYDLVSRFRNDVFIENSDLTIYKPINDDPAIINLGSSAAERLEIKALYASGTQEVNQAHFTTYTASVTGNRGSFVFYVDEIGVATIWDSGIDLEANMGISINDVDILTDSSGTATLSNIDALDATTIATFEAAIESNIDTITNDLTISTTGTQLKLAHNANDYATFTVADTGDLTITTVGDGTRDSDLILDADGEINLNTATGFYRLTSTATSAAGTGPKLNLVSDDRDALGDDHLIGRIAFAAAEDTGGTLRSGARIEALADAAWSASENGTRLEF